MDINPLKDWIRTSKMDSEYKDLFTAIPLLTQLPLDATVKTAYGNGEVYFATSISLEEYEKSTVIFFIESLLEENNIKAMHARGVHFSRVSLRGKRDRTILWIGDGTIITPGAGLEFMQRKIMEAKKTHRVVLHFKETPLW